MDQEDADESVVTGTENNGDKEAGVVDANDYGFFSSRSGSIFAQMK